MGQLQTRALTEAEIAEMRRRAAAETERNERLAANGQNDTGSNRNDTIVVTGNGLRGQTWAGDTVDTIARAWLDANPNSGMRFMQVRDWIIRNNRLTTVNGENCEGNMSRVPNIRVGQTLVIPEGNEITSLNWKYACPLPLPPVPNQPAPPPPTPPVQVPPPVQNNVTGLEYYPYQATTQGDNNNGLTNAYEMLAATGVEPFVYYYRRPDIMAREGSNRTPRTGQGRDYMNQGERRDDSPLSRRDNDAPRITEERHNVQGAFYGGNLLNDDGTPNVEAQSRFLAGQGFTGNDDRQWVAARTGPMFWAGTREQRGDMHIGQTSTTVDGAVMPTYTLSSEDFVNRDIWFFNNPARTSAPVGTYDRALAYGDYQIVSREFREGSQSIIARLEGGDTTITRAEVQRVLDAGAYAQMNVLVRDAGIHRDIQAVTNNIGTRFESYQWPATDTSPALVVRDGVSPAIFDTPVADLGGYRLRVASRERFDQLGDQFGAGFRFDGFRGIEGQEITGAYRVIHQRPTAVGQYVAENRSILVRGDRDTTGQQTSAALAAVVGTAEAPNLAGATGLWNVAAGRPETATVITNALSRAYNNPEEYGFRDRREVEAFVVNLTGLPSERQRSNDGVRGNEGDRGRNATDDAIGSSDRGSTIPIYGSYISGLGAMFGNNEGRMIDPQAFARTVAPRVAGDQNLQAQSAAFFARLPVADQVALLQSVGSDPRVDANFGVPQSMRELATASGASVDRQSPLFQGVVASEVFSRSGYSDVNVSSRGYVEDWLNTYRAWQANGRQGAAPTIAMSTNDIARLQASGELTPEEAALIRSNNTNVDTAGTRNIVARGNGDFRDVDAALTAGNTNAAFAALVSGPQAVASGAPQLVVESMRFNPALAANLVTATMLRDPDSFDQPISHLRALDRQYTGGGLPIIGNLFGALDADKYGQAADALERSQERVARLGPATLEAARNGDARALRRVDEAMSPWNDFTATMMSNPTSNGGHLRYAAYEQVWDAIGRDPRAQSAMVQTMTAVPQFQEAAIEILNSTRVQSVDMREQQFIGRRGGDRTHAIPQPVNGPAIDAASGLFVTFEPGRRGRVNANVNAAALVAPAAPAVPAAATVVPDSAAAALAAGGTVTVVTADGAVAGQPAAGQPGAPAAVPSFTVINGVTTLTGMSDGSPIPADVAAAALAAGNVVTGQVAPAAPAVAAGEAAAGQPAAGQPAAGQPAAGQPAAGQPAAGQPAAGQPAAGQPAAGQPAAGQPAAGQPAAGQPAAGQPAAGQPAAGQPAAGQPAAGQPAAGQPAAGQPAAGQPAAGQPAAGTVQISAGTIASIDGVQAAGATLLAGGAVSSPTLAAGSQLPGAVNPFTPEMLFTTIIPGTNPPIRVIDVNCPGCGGPPGTPRPVPGGGIPGR